MLFQFLQGHRYEAGVERPFMVPSGAIAAAIKGRGGFSSIVVRDRAENDHDMAAPGVDWDTFVAVTRTGPTDFQEIPAERVAFVIDLDADKPVAAPAPAPAVAPAASSAPTLVDATALVLAGCLVGAIYLAIRR